MSFVCPKCLSRRSVKSFEVDSSGQAVRMTCVGRPGVLYAFEPDAGCHESFTAEQLTTWATGPECDEFRAEAKEVAAVVMWMTAGSEAGRKVAQAPARTEGDLNGRRMRRRAMWGGKAPRRCWRK